MKKVLTLFKSRGLALSALAGIALCLGAHSVKAQSLISKTNKETLLEKGQTRSLTLQDRSRVSYDAYILGPGDALQIEILDLPELSGNFSIGPDGTLYLPRLRALYVEGLTIEELRVLLTQQFSTYLRNPQLYIRPVAYRPIRVYVGGEVRRPGFYTLFNGTDLSQMSQSAEVEQMKRGTITNETRPGIGQVPGGASASNGGKGLSTFGAIFPTVFDAIKSAQGITPYTDLSKVQVIRNRAEGLGGGRIKANLNFLSLITEGDESQNIRLFDGDALYIGKSQTVLRDQLLKAGQSNLTPQFINVFVSGRVKSPGSITIPQGASLNQAISLAGGAKVLKGKVEFVRFNQKGTLDRKIFSHKPGSEIDTPSNPVLADGDLIRVNDSIVSSTVEVVNEVTMPFVGLYSTYSLINGIAQ